MIKEKTGEDVEVEVEEKPKKGKFKVKVKKMKKEIKHTLAELSFFGNVLALPVILVAGWYVLYIQDW